MQEETIDLNKYVTFETTGYNGYGNVYPQIDWEKIQKKYDSRLKFTKEFEEIKTEFNGQTRILCEEFQVVYDCTATYQK